MSRPAGHLVSCVPFADQGTALAEGRIARNLTAPVLPDVAAQPARPMDKSATAPDLRLQASLVQRVTASAASGARPEAAPATQSTASATPTEATTASSPAQNGAPTTEASIVPPASATTPTVAEQTAQAESARDDAALWVEARLQTYDAQAVEGAAIASDDAGDLHTARSGAEEDPPVQPVMEHQPSYSKGA